ncbi:MAG TPA: hypothetical protein VK914_02175 [bacterium]|nr:hypothetical protein [bacterium]
MTSDVQATALALAGVATVLAGAREGSAALGVARALPQCLGVLAATRNPEKAWSFSGLCADGCPLEFTFSNRHVGLSFTVDAAPPECAPQDRLEAAVALALRLGYAGPSPQKVRQWGAMQAGRTLLWGARLGFREQGNRAALKYYVEVPAAAPAAGMPATVPRFDDSHAVMIGHDPDHDRTEFYFQRRLFSLKDLRQVLDVLPSAAGRGALEDGIEQLCGRRLLEALYWTYFGYSVSLGADGEAVPAFFAKSGAIGGARRARGRMLQTMPEAVKERSLYHRLLAGLPDSALPEHGIMSVCLGTGPGPELRTGLSGLALARLLADAGVR